MNVGNDTVVAVMGLTTIELVKLWQSVAPTLEQARADNGSDYIRQRYMDADHLGAGLALLVGGTTSVMLKSWLPVIMALGSVVVVSRWHHWVLKSDNWMVNDG